MEAEERTIDDVTDCTIPILTLLRAEPLEDIQKIIDAVKTLTSEDRKLKEMRAAVLRHLNRLTRIEIDGPLMEKMLELMHLFELQDGDLTQRDKFSRLATTHIIKFRIEFRTKDDAWKFYHKCKTAGVSENAEIKKIARRLIMKFVNNDELTERLSELFGISDLEKKDLVTRGRETFNALMRLQGVNI
ncbi:hypothetical protein HYV57_01945 [Candidatus Peregrinibacteria bacterium]|nr:hypothetical protein [Candidatus Peregrinibacteria bacterium]